MNKIFLLACMDDWQMSARLANLSAAHSYELIFCENNLQLPDLKARIILIIDLDSMSENAFQKAYHFKSDDSVFIIGYAHEIGAIQIKHSRRLGDDIVLRRKKLLKNIDTILNKIINAI